LYTLLTGLGEQDPLKRGTMKDPRASSLASAVSRMSLSSNATADSKHSRLPDMVMGARSAADNKAFYNAVEGVVTEKLTALVQIPAEQIIAQTKLIDIGMDSMLAVMARQEATLGKDVPLADFTATMITVGEVGRKVADGLLSQHKKAEGTKNCETP